MGNAFLLLFSLCACSGALLSHLGHAAWGVTVVVIAFALLWLESFEQRERWLKRNRTLSRARTWHQLHELEHRAYLGEDALKEAEARIRKTDELVQTGGATFVTTRPPCMWEALYRE